MPFVLCVVVSLACCVHKELIGKGHHEVQVESPFVGCKAKDQGIAKRCKKESSSKFESTSSVASGQKKMNSKVKLIFPLPGTAKVNLGMGSEVFVYCHLLSSLH